MIRRMEAETSGEEQTPKPEAEIRSVQPGREAAMRFFVGFCIVTLAALVGHGYTLSTHAHMRYMHELARHTSWGLSLIGERVDLEPMRRDASSWESWRERAELAVERGDNLEEIGPVIYFVLPGLTDEGFPHTFTFRVVPKCGAIPLMIIYLAAVLLFPLPWWTRIAGAFGGLAILYLINVVRLVVLAYIGAIDNTPGQRWFTFVHEYVWQAAYLVIVVLVWLGWYSLASRWERKRA